MRRSSTPVAVILLAISIFISAALAACGYSSAGASPTPTRTLTPGSCPNSTAAQQAALLGGEMPLHAAPRVMPVTTLPPGVTVGQVQVVVESGDYTPQSTIFAWAGNGLSQCIYATDHQSDCSIVVLERQVNGEWQPQATCQTATATRIVGLPPMQAAFIRLTPPAAGTQAGTWPAGTYRVAFAYRLDREDTGQPTAVYSATFTIA